MKTAALLLAVAASLSLAQQSEPPRDGMDFVLGGGAWLPGLMNEDNQLSVGYAFMAGIETPMFQEDQFRLTAGPAFCGSDRNAYDGITAVMLNLGYRKFPFYRPYAGPRALEPFIGLTGGGILVWDAVAEGSSADSKSTGGAMLGVEAGTRIRVGETTGLDITLSADWVPIGSALAGESDEDLSGIRIQGSLVF
jgi:hypothetical protein